MGLGSCSSLSLIVTVLGPPSATGAREGLCHLLAAQSTLTLPATCTQCTQCIQSLKAAAAGERGLSSLRWQLLTSTLHLDVD